VYFVLGDRPVAVQVVVVDVGVAEQPARVPVDWLSV
jgi:hypothetical protein